MKPARLLLLLPLAVAVAARAGDLGGHELAKPLIAESAPADERGEVLEEMWQRRLLPPDQRDWSPQDLELLRKIRRAENDALELLKKRFGTNRRWTVPVRAGSLSTRRLTKEGYEKYLFALTQDALGYFESKGADAKWAFKLRDMDGRPLFDGRGLITDEGALVYKLARLNREVFWKSPDGDVSGTRRPPAQKP